VCVSTSHRAQPLLHGAAVSMKLAEEEGSLWIQQLVVSVVIVTCLIVAYRVVDIVFALLLEEAFAAVELEDFTVKEMKQLYTAVRRKEGRDGHVTSSSDSVGARARVDGDKTGSGGWWCFKRSSAKKSGAVAAKNAEDDDESIDRARVDGDKTGSGGWSCLKRFGAKKGGAIAANFAKNDDNGIDQLERGSALDHEQHALEHQGLRERERERKLFAKKTPSPPMHAADDNAAPSKPPVRNSRRAARLRATRKSRQAQSLLIVRRFVKAAVGYIFLSWLLRTWGTDMTVFIAFSAVGALALAFSLKEVNL